MTNNQSENDKILEQMKCELERLRANAEQLHDIGSEIKRNGAFVIDLANQGLVGVSALPLSQDYSHLYSAISGLNNSLINSLNTLANVPASNATGITFHGTLTIDAFDSIFTTFQTDNLPSPPYLEPIKNAWDGIKELSYHPSLRDEALAQIDRLRIDSTEGGKSAKKQLNAAWNTHLEYPQSPTSSLITMRETIEMVLNELIRRRPIQREVLKKEKIIEIGKQCFASYTNQTDFINFESEWRKLKDDLSKEKKGTANRETELDLMRKATRLLIQILTAIDPAKFRSNA